MNRTKQVAGAAMLAALSLPAAAHAEKVNVGPKIDPVACTATIDVGRDQVDDPTLIFRIEAGKFSATRKLVYLESFDFEGTTFTRTVSLRGLVPGIESAPRFVIVRGIVHRGPGNVTGRGTAHGMFQCGPVSKPPTSTPTPVPSETPVPLASPTPTPTPVVTPTPPAVTPPKPPKPPEQCPTNIRVKLPPQSKTRGIGRFGALPGQGVVRVKVDVARSKRNPAADGRYVPIRLDNGWVFWRPGIKGWYRIRLVFTLKGGCRVVERVRYFNPDPPA